MIKKARIAICQEYPLALRGGVSVLVETLLEDLAAHFELVLVSADPSDKIAKSPIGPLLHAHFSWKDSAASAATSRGLADRLAAAGVQLAHLHMGGNYGWGNRIPYQAPMLYLHRQGIPVCTTDHSVMHLLDGFCAVSKPLAFKLALFPLAYAGKMHSLAYTRKELAVSRHNFELLRRWYPGHAHRFGYLYHSRLRVSDRTDSTVPREKTILNVGHLAERKGQHILAEAFARIAPNHPDWTLQLVGPIPEPEPEQVIRAIAAKHGLEKRILLAGSHADVRPWLNRAGIYAQPSLWEALGLALQEAMFQGCAAIGTRVGGIPELITHGQNGLLVPAGDAGEMARALDRLIQNTEERKAFGAAAAKSVVAQGMTREQMVRNHLQLYESLLANR